MKPRRCMCCNAELIEGENPNLCQECIEFGDDDAYDEEYTWDEYADKMSELTNRAHERSEGMER